MRDKINFKKIIACIACLVFIFQVQFFNVKAENIKAKNDLSKESSCCDSYFETATLVFGGEFEQRVIFDCYSDYGYLGCIDTGWRDKELGVKYILDLPIGTREVYCNVQMNFYGGKYLDSYYFSSKDSKVYVETYGSEKHPKVKFNENK